MEGRKRKIKRKKRHHGLQDREGREPSRTGFELPIRAQLHLEKKKDPSGREGETTRLQNGAGSETRQGGGVKESRMESKGTERPQAGARSIRE